jgi:GntR family transcriptional regulator
MIRTLSSMNDLPLYEQVRQSLASAIASGEYGPGDKLPSETTLAAEMGVNRLTVRRAIEELARAGLVQSRQGSGTYVARSVVRLPVSQSLSTDSLVSSITQQINEQGHAYEDVLLKATKVNNPQANAELRLPSGPLWRVDNALVVDDDVWMWSSSWFPQELLKDPKRNWSSVSGLYGQLNDSIGELVPVWRAFSAEAATAEDAETLGVKAGTPLIVRDGLTADQDGNPVLRVSRRARMDRVSYVLRY